MKKIAFLILILLTSLFIAILPALAQKELPKVAVWDLEPRNVSTSYAKELTSILVSELSKLGKYEVYSQENVRTIAGWTAERMKLGCTDTQCLIALGQIDVAKLISGSVAKIGNRYSISLNLFDTQNTRAEKSVSEFGRSEDELIDLIQVAAGKLLGKEVVTSKVEEEIPEKPIAAALPEYGKPFKDPLAGIEFVFIKGGCFQMGDTFGDGGSDERPVHEVCVDDFYLGKYEVTQAQWEKVMGNNPSHFKEKDNPVEHVSWNDVQQFIGKLNIASGRKYRGGGDIFDKIEAERREYRLPTEAEWEYAARSGGKKEKWAGTSQESHVGEYAWYSGDLLKGDRIHPVGQKKPNGLGLYDMSGNVWEWCADWYHENYYKSSPKDNPEGPSSGTYRVLRGGSWWNTPNFRREADGSLHKLPYSTQGIRSSMRSSSNPAIRGFLDGDDFGFRLGLSAR